MRIFYMRPDRVRAVHCLLDKDVFRELTHKMKNINAIGPSGIVSKMVKQQKEKEYAW